MYICIDCGSVFDESEVYVDSYNHASYGERPAVETWECCPSCRGDITEAYECCMCGSYHAYDDLFGYGDKVCNDCIQKHSDVDTCLKLGEIDKQEVRLNSFLLSLFDEGQIEAVLLEKLQERRAMPLLFGQVNTDCFVSEDKDWFATALIEKGVK